MARLPAAPPRKRRENSIPPRDLTDARTLQLPLHARRAGMVGDDALVDYPHPRHSCAVFKFDTTNHKQERYENRRLSLTDHKTGTGTLPQSSSGRNMSNLLGTEATFNAEPPRHSTSAPVPSATLHYCNAEEIALRLEAARPVSWRSSGDPLQTQWTHAEAAPPYS